jgi:hypothetical protein
MSITILISAVLGGAIGAALWFVERLWVGKRNPNGHKAARGLISFLTVVMIVGVAHSTLPATVAGWFQKTPTVATSPEDALTNAVMSDPALAAQFQGLSAADAQTKGQQLAARGIARLDDQTLRTRADILSALLSKVSEPTCSAFARGTTTSTQQAEFVAAINELPNQQRSQWYGMSLAAVRATVAQTPLITADASVLPAAMQALKAHLNASDVASVDAVLAGNASDAQECEGVRALYEGALIIPETDGAVILRELASG